MKVNGNRETNPVTAFYLKLSLIICMVIIAIYVGIYLRDRRLIMETVTQQARSYYDLLIKVRRWNASFGGVYVEKKPGVVTNRYLAEMGVDPEITTTDGRTFTLKNPFLMTYEISNDFGKDERIRFHITSLRLVDRANAPDPFERDALQRFERGEKERWSIEQGPDGPLFRYMAPLLVEQSCQKCHFKMGYRLGDVRGGICINIPIHKLHRELALNRTAVIYLSLLTLALLLGSTYYILSGFVAKLRAAQQSLQEASITDDLTGLRNRRYFMSRFEEEIVRSRREGSLLGLLMIDLDNFKQVNDTCGHQFGDLVLATTARAFAGMLREYDVAARYGGEEFALIVSVKSKEDLVALAERIREKIAALDIQDASTCARTTASIGVAVLEKGDTQESLLKRADQALYEAKRNGRNNVFVM
ncbi:MAG TPA: diguanylate cyclase [Geomonas sp.]|nr:diguanylate cyclase [Geomonas sp.]